MGNLNHTIALYRFSEDLKRFNTAWGTHVNDRFFVFFIKDKEVEKLEGDRKDGTDKFLKLEDIKAKILYNNN